MRYEFKRSFERSVKSLCETDKADVKAACLAFIDFIENELPLPSGMGLKRLRREFWEIRLGIRARILFRWKGDLLEFVIAGNHDSIKDFLKNNS